MATFNYIEAVWRNGPGVVSDAPDWVLGAFERTLPGWLQDHDRDLVGAHFDRESGLCVWIFVSPSARSRDGQLADAPEGSFVHVVASDRAAEGDATPTQARHLFESVYGAALSDAALRQQRSYMLLDFPYHRALASDWFVAKDTVEGEAPGPAPTTPGAGERPPDGLPFDQGLSYQEVVDRLADAALRQARDAPESIPKLTTAAGRTARAPSEAGARETGAPDPDAVAGERGAAGEAQTLSVLLGGRARPKPSDGLPFDQGLSYSEVLSRLADAVQGVPGAERGPVSEPFSAKVKATTKATAPVTGDPETVVSLASFSSVPAATPGARTDAAEPEPLDLGRLQPAPTRRRSSPGRDSSAPVFVAAGFVFFLFAVMGVIGLQLSLPAGDRGHGEAPVSPPLVAGSRDATPQEDAGLPATAAAPDETAAPVVKQPVEVAARPPKPRARPSERDRDVAPPDPVARESASPSQASSPSESASPAAGPKPPAGVAVATRAAVPPSTTASSSQTPEAKPTSEAPGAVASSEPAPRAVAAATAAGSGPAVAEAAASGPSAASGEPIRVQPIAQPEPIAAVPAGSEPATAAALPVEPESVAVLPAVSATTGSVASGAGATVAEADERAVDEPDPEVERRRRERRRLLQQIQRYR